MNYQQIFSFIPEVRKPEEKKVDFNTKLKWTLVILGLFFVLINIPLFGLSESALERFEFLATILGTDFGSIIALGIGPIVMASIILQLLAGAGIINIDTSTVEGKRLFQGMQKILIFFFIIFEAFVYVLMGGFQATPELGNLGPAILIIQLILGGFAIYYMNEVSDKWGFGSGVSLFIAAGVSLSLFTSAFQFVNQQGRNCLLDFTGTSCPGKVLVLVQSLVNKYPIEFLSAFGALVATIVVFLLVVWAQSLKAEIPLSHGRVRGYGIKWPLSFFYTGVIPVILSAALIAQITMFGGIIDNAATMCAQQGDCSGFNGIASYIDIFGDFNEGQAVSGFAFWISSSNILEILIRGGFQMKYLLQGLIHTLFFVLLSTMFAFIWMKTSGSDAKSQAQKISASGLHIAGFRQDTRVLETILNRYITPLTIMGGIAIGLLASVTNLIGALVSGTSMLLVIMIMFQFYQNIVQQHQSDMNPAMRKFMGA